MTGTADETAREKLTQLATGYRITQALYVAAKLGIADRLVRGPRDARSLAEEVGVRPDPLFRVLRALASYGVFTMDAERRFGLTPVGECLCSASPRSLAAFAALQGEEAYRAFGELLNTVRTGETAFDTLFGMGHFDYLAQHAEASLTFHRTMAAAHPESGDPLEGCDLRQAHTVVDIGGGQGALLAAILRHHTGLRGILFDLPNAVNGAASFLESAGLSDRCEIRTGSAFESVPSGGDTYVMSRILHDWPDEKALPLLRNCRKAIPDNGVLILRDAVLGEGEIAPALAQLDLMMMTMNGGRERTEREWRELVGRAGFALRSIQQGHGNLANIVVVPVPPPATG